MIKRYWIYFLLLSFIYQMNLFAQKNSQPDTAKTFWSKNFSISGEVGAYGELYSISGRQKRRPATTGRIYFRPTIHLFNLIDIPFVFLISTEGNTARQNINQFGINPSWSWGTLHLGDFSGSFSDFSLNGILIRGGGVDIHPGLFNLSVVGGYTRRAVAGGALNGSFDRYLYGIKIGVGKNSGSNFNLIFLRVRDVPSSLSPGNPSVTVISPNGGDVLPIGSIQTIRWTSANLTDNVKIELSRNGGISYDVLFTNEPNVGSVSWTVTGTQTYQALIRISSMNDSTIDDVSDQEFTIGTNVTGESGDIIPVITNEAAVTPQENLVTGATWRINFLNRLISWQSEVDGSVYTRDMRAETINLDSTKIPGFVKNIYSPKIGTNIDYSIHSLIGFHFQSVNAQVGYKLIGPGYTSLGLSYLINDQQEISARTSFRISRFGINLNWARLNDNLIQQKLYTTLRNQYNISISGMITSFWNGSIITSILNMGNDSNNDTTKVNFSTFILSTNHSFMLNKNSILRNINLSYSYQTSGDNSPLRKNTKSINNNINIGLNFQLTKSISANASGGIISSKFADTISTSTNVFSVGAQSHFLKNKMTASVSVSSSATGSNNALNIRISSGYQLSKSDRIYLSLMSNHFNGGSSSGGSSFTESMASLTVSHRF